MTDVLNKYQVYFFHASFHYKNQFFDIFFYISKTNILHGGFDKNLSVIIFLLHIIMENTCFKYKYLFNFYCYFKVRNGYNVSFSAFCIIFIYFFKVLTFQIASNCWFQSSQKMLKNATVILLGSLKYVKSCICFCVVEKALNGIYRMLSSSQFDYEIKLMIFVCRILQIGLT